MLLKKRAWLGVHGLHILAEHVVLFAFHILKVEVSARHALVDALDVIAGRLEVGGCVVGIRDKNLKAKSKGKHEIFMQMMESAAKTEIAEETHFLSQVTHSLMTH